jgi:hypothetical protein
MMGRFGVKPLNQKKVQANQAGGTENKKKSDIAPVASGMQKFVKSSSNDTAPTKAANPKASIPMIFRRKAPVK